MHILRRGNCDAALIGNAGGEILEFIAIGAAGDALSAQFDRLEVDLTGAPSPRVVVGYREGVVEKVIAVVPRKGVLSEGDPFDEPSVAIVRRLARVSNREAIGAVITQGERLGLPAGVEAVERRCMPGCPERLRAKTGAKLRFRVSWRCPHDTPAAAICLAEGHSPRRHQITQSDGTSPATRTPPGLPRVTWQIRCRHRWPRRIPAIRCTAPITPQARPDGSCDELDASVLAESARLRANAQRASEMNCPMPFHETAPGRLRDVRAAGPQAAEGTDG
jgi:hypothetical protein